MIEVEPRVDPIDDDEEWVNQAQRRGVRVPAAIGALVLVLVAVCGIWGGAVLQKHHDKSAGSTSAAASGFAGAAAARRGAAGAGGAGGFGGLGAAGAAGGRTLGTVSDVEGSTVFLTDASGAIIKVTLAPSTTITKTTAGTAADIQLGQSVIVSGTKGADGTTSAATITIVPATASAPAPAAGG
jgi:hypothetical protein